MEPLPYVPDILALSDLTLRPNPGRTILRPFLSVLPDDVHQQHSRPQQIAERVIGLSESEVQRVLALVLAAMRRRIEEPDKYLRSRFNELNAALIAPGRVSPEREQLIAAYFCSEYSFEAAALFNPSMIRQLETPVLPDGRVQFVLSLRAVGEGHVSSVTFRTGRWSAATDFEIDSTSNEAAVLHALSEVTGDGETTHLIAPEGRSLSDMVIFPSAPSQRQGIEDMRMVVFEDEDLGPQLFGTYTAFDGRDARPEMMCRTDEGKISCRPLRGRYATGKGMALFPRKIEGKYLMLSRQDQQNVWLLRSDDLYQWDAGTKLLAPAVPWEYVQLGNCGSPIEIDEGWLVLTHAVGPVRLYTMGACLLDKRDPARVLARMRHPLLRPTQVGGRDGYVPNVVYSCGGMVHERTLLLPFAVADSITRFASVGIEELLAAMDWSP